MAQLLRSLSRTAGVLRQSSCLVARRGVTSTPIRSAIAKGETMAYEEMEQFWAKNRALKRPLSPSITQTKYHITMVLSITNRVFSVALQGGITLGAIALLMSRGKFPEYLKMVNSSAAGAALIFLTKLALAASTAFHVVMGFRHFIWDTGAGYSKPMTLKGSYAVCAITLVFTLVLMAIKPPMPQVQ